MTEPGTVIRNVATVSYGFAADPNAGATPVAIEQTATSVLTTQIPHAVEIHLGSVATQSGDFTLQGGATCQRPGQGLSAPKFVSGSSATPGDNVSFVEGPTIKSGDALFVEVYDDAANRNSLEVEAISVVLTTPSNDAETVRLLETGPGTGRFVGYIQTGRTVVTAGDCLLSVSSNQRINALYRSAATVQTTVQASILVDPIGVVFDAATGARVDGIRITLLNVATGQPAEVFGDDGVSRYPSTMISGSIVTDSSGAVYPATPGQFRFPLVRTGTYRLVVGSEGNYTFPTQFTVADLQQTFGTTFSLSAASLGEPFSVVAAVVQVDVPVDTASGKLVVTKTASIGTASIGDFVRYTITVTNKDPAAVPNVVVRDQLPPGLRLKAGSVFVGVTNSVRGNPVILDSSTFTQAVGTLAGGASVTLRYVAEITPLTPLGRSRNLARANGSGAFSNEAFAQVDVRDDLLSDRMVVLGSVREVTSCKNLPGKPVEGVRILFETGDYVVSDKLGLWSMDRLRVDDHVARIDPQSIPKGYEAVLCENTSEFAGNASSRFVRGKSASLLRADFYLKRTQARIDEDAAKLAELLQSRILGESSEPAAKGPVDRAGTSAYTLHAEFVASLTTERKIMFPGENFSPMTTAVGVAISAPTGEVVRLFVNDTEVSRASFDGYRDIEKVQASIHYWSAVAIKDGLNTLEARFFKDEVQVGSAQRIISFSSNIANAVLEPQRSTLIADGRTPIEVAVKLTDEFGRPAYKGLSGTFDVEGGFSPWIDRAFGAPAAIVSRLKENQTTFTVGEGGVAIIKLEPSSTGGEALVTLSLKDKRLLLRPWIRSASQPWVVVGFAKGTVAHKKISDSLRRTQGGADLVDDGGRVAFFAKGTIPGDLLATIAYDTRAKRPTLTPSAADGSANNAASALRDANEQAFEVYGDESGAKKDAERTGKLYVRIERDRFYAMFGQSQAGLSVTELTRYDRLINGFRTEYRGDRTSLSAFASEITGVHQIFELPVSAVVGAYAAKTPIKVNSEIVSVVTRSATQRDRILDRKMLTRFIDYEVDYGLGVIRLKQTIQPVDLGFNPVFVRVEFDTDEDVGTSRVSGGRVATKPMAAVAGLEVGLSGVKEASQYGAGSQLAGVDVRYASPEGDVSGSVEAARSSKDVDGASVSGQAVYAQGQYRNGDYSVQAYAKKVDPGYGSTNALAADVALQKVGIETTGRISDSVSMAGTLVTQKDLTTGAKSRVAEAKLQGRLSDQATAYIGAKNTQTQSAQADGSASGVLTPSAVAADDNIISTIAGAQYAFKDIPVRALAQVELPSTISDTVARRIRVGAEYDVTKSVTLTADQELDQYDTARYNFSRVGIKSTPWSGGQVQFATGVLTGSGELAGNTYQRGGIDQTVELFPGLSADVGYTRQRWSKTLPKATLPAGALLSLDDYTSARLGLVYRRNTFSSQVRAESLEGRDSSRMTLQGNVFQRVDARFSLTAGFTAERLKLGGVDVVSSSTNTNIVRAGMSYRDALNPLTALVEVSYRDVAQVSSSLESAQVGQVVQVQAAGSDRARSVIVNAMENYKIGSRWEVFGHQGIKQTFVTFDGQGYDGMTYLLNAGAMYYVTPEVDLSASALRAYAISSKVGSKGAALAVGYTFHRNAHVSVGYQLLDQFDRNFAFNEAYVSGVFLKVQLKFDENTLGLNSDSVATK